MSSLPDNLRSRIASMIAADQVVLFMKGDRGQPRCGFSAQVVSILDEIIPSYTTYDILADQELREGVKAYSDWPTYPQLYVKGELVGGCDIVKEMFAKGSLYEALGAKPPTPVAPKISITAAAAKKLREAAQSDDGQVLRLAIDGHFRHDLYLGDAQSNDAVVESEGLRLHLDAPSSRRADGLRVDFVDRGLEGAGFKIDNPNAPTPVRQLSVKDLKKRLDANKNLQLIDVRTPMEHMQAQIAGAKLFDGDVERDLLALPKDTELFFFCHNGGRSQAAAEQFLRQGFKNVYNVVGGIDAWSREIDPSVRRY